MPFCEQLFFGSDLRHDPPTRGVLGMSSGLGQEVAGEVERLCRGWGDPTPFGLQRPALMSFPLAAIMPSIRGRLYAVIRVGPGSDPLLHAIILGDAHYTVFDRNPYLLARLVAYPESWPGGAAPPRLDIDAETHEFPEALAPREGDRGFIDEAVVQLIAHGRLILPLEQSSAESDRALALMIACLPARMRRDMRFASLANSEANAYTLGAVAGAGGTFQGWHRLLLATPAGGLTPDVVAYQAAIAHALDGGDLNAIARLSLRHEFGVGPEAESVVASVPEHRAPGEPRRFETPVAAVVGQAERTGRPGAPRPGRVEGFEQRPGSARHGAPAATGISSGFTTAAVLTRTTAGGTSRPARRLSGPDGSAPNRPLTGRRGLTRTLAVIFVVFLAGWVVTMRVNGHTLAQSLEWAGIPGMSGVQQEGETSPTLLEVVDVGRVYEDQRASLAGAGDGLGPSVDQARRKALANLTARAATPLVAQIDLFTKLSADGIQQGSRPDRETERLRALAGQGEMLGNELKRLELAWYGLGSGALWRDLRTLSDEGVAARSDSLTRRDRASLDEARTGMGLTWKIKELAEARRNVDGMASLVELFQASTWNPRWAADLKAAADRVSPSSSQLTRAYRNCAFQLLRVKDAERAAANRGLPFATELAAGSWPSPAVRELLRDLRRSAGTFQREDAPTLVAGVLKLYSELADPARAVGQAAADPQYLARIEANPAFRFDAAAYRPFLDRLRYEASLRRGGGNDARARDAVRFAQAAGAGRSAPQWKALADSLKTPFLSEWARRNAGSAESVAGERRTARAKQLQSVRDAAGDLRRAAAEARDWSDEWRRTSTLATRFLGEAASSGDGSDGTAEVAELAAALDKVLPLRLEDVTVRLAPAGIPEAEVAVFEVSVPGRAEVWRSRAFAVGPAAPAGTGWVGHVGLGWTVPLGAREPLGCRLVAADGRTLLEFSASALADGGGPGAFGRLSAGDGNSIQLKIGPGWWSALALPTPSVVF